MDLCKPAIVVIAYNRDKALYRLLDSISKASYPDKNINLIISIDKGDNPKVYTVADDFEWNYGEKTVIRHPERNGLKDHVLSCGDLSEKYGSVILLEDDLYVSKGFYEYAVKALEFSSRDNKISGISLYNHLFNVHVREPFEAVNDGYDNYYFQFASSWGQGFSKEQWRGFRDYLKLHDNENIAAYNVPLNVSSWSDKSWLKHCIKYMIENDLYFLYPRVSLTTNFMEEGMHAKSVCDDLQVSLLCNDKNNWNFSNLRESKSVYDAFFENMGIMEKDVCIDLYGYKEINEESVRNYKRLLSSKPYPYKVIKSYGRHFRPLDMNIIEQAVGEDLFLYDLSVAAVAPKVNLVQKLLYNYRGFKSSYGIEIIKHRLKKTIIK